MGAYAMHAKHDPRKTTEAARERANWGRFLDMVDADEPGLSDDERNRRATALRRSHLAACAHRSAKARRVAKEARQLARQARHEADELAAGLDPE